MMLSAFIQTDLLKSKCRPYMISELLFLPNTEETVNKECDLPLACQFSEDCLVSFKCVMKVANCEINLICEARRHVQHCPHVNCPT